MQHGMIMAGGAGTRLWPLSRKARPKQLVKLVRGQSLLRLSYDRVAAVVGADAVNIITGQAHLPLIKADMPEIPDANLIGEPMGRDTANAVGLAAAVLQRRDPEAVIGTFTADHIIQPLETFKAAVELGLKMAQEHPDALVTFGITPRHPDTGFGYVQRGTKLADGVYEVAAFKEKPALEVAKQYVESGDYYWNSGMFAWRADTILNQLAKHLPEAHAGIMEIAAAWGSSDQQAVLERIYPELPKISIDFAVMEKAPRVLVVEMNCDWLDVGSWPALADVLDADESGNVFAAADAICVDANGNIIVGEDDHLVAAFGVSDLVIVHATDATLVCRKDDAPRLKELVEKVKERHGERYA
jgi:mannose-1-phosphate guanylyltransferase